MTIKCIIRKGKLKSLKVLGSSKAYLLFDEYYSIIWKYQKDRALKGDFFMNTNVYA